MSTLVGTTIAGAWQDGPGTPMQSHLVYAVNAGVWWLFTIKSTLDGDTTRVVQCYYSSSADLSTATWTAATNSPVWAGGSIAGSMQGGRALAVGYVQNGTTDAIHAEIASSRSTQHAWIGHIRATVTATTISWDAAWVDVDNGGSSTPRKGYGVIGLSTGNFVHTGNELASAGEDCYFRKSTNADTGSTWTNLWTAGFKTQDATMTNFCLGFGVVPLASDVMLAVYDNGGAVDPNLTNLRYKKSPASGDWTTPNSGDGNVFSATSTQDHNDWCVIGISTTSIYACRRSSTTQIDVNVYSTGGNSWSATANQPPAFGGVIKAGGGVMGVTNGTDLWLFIVDGTNNVISYIKYGIADGVWGSWTTLETVDSTATFLSGFPKTGPSNRAGLVYAVTNGANFDTYVSGVNLVPGGGSLLSLGVGN